ncbi:hypothetical protein [Litorisediminicola beolgyonensis]|uniref:Uncharacterized protein n=1 Tax=Litorisediminicola beolgyonensis TaxID=1173614 RepID=A0ABW3ZN79_9RHOB
MKTLFTLTAVSLLAIAGAASAMAPSDVDASQVQKIAPGADLTGLSDAEVAAVMNAIRSTESVSDTRAYVTSLLKAFQ